MNKSYRCDFCAHDVPITNEYCKMCSLGSYFELKKRMSTRQSEEWIGHRKLDKYLDTLSVQPLDYQRDFLHRLIEMPQPIYMCMRPRHGRIVYSTEYRRVRMELLDAIRKVKLEEGEP